MNLMLALFPSTAFAALFKQQTQYESMEIADQLKALEAQKEAIAEREKELMELAKEQEAASQRLEKLVETSDYESPKELVEALVKHFDITFRGRKKKTALKMDGTPRRRRTKVTSELRDEVKAEVNEGNSMNQVAKRRGISYAVISNICQGKYDHL